MVCDLDRDCSPEEIHVSCEKIRKYENRISRNHQVRTPGQTIYSFLEAGCKDFAESNEDVIRELI
jgi:hypothetical protein